MLVISRKPGESIRIGSDIRIEVVSIKGKTIRLGIEADDDTLILREEVLQRQSPEMTVANPPADGSLNSPVN